MAEKVIPVLSPESVEELREIRNDDDATTTVVAASSAENQTETLELSESNSTDNRVTTLSPSTNTIPDKEIDPIGVSVGKDTKESGERTRSDESDDKTLSPKPQKCSEVAETAEDKNSDENQNSDDNTNGDALADQNSISKRQRKKMLRQEGWREKRQERRQKYKEKKKLKKSKQYAESLQTPTPIGEPEAKKVRLNKITEMESSVERVSVAIDLSFDDLMRDQDVRKLLKQVQRCYAVNRRASQFVKMYLTSYGKKCKERMESATPECRSWQIFIRSESYTELFDKPNIVYLTSESDNILTSLEPHKVYIIGGLVDHNAQKGLCYRRAIEAGVSHAQLPISEHLKLVSRKVLAVNHVFEILLAYLELGDWKEALLSVIPRRKLTADTTDDIQ